MTTEMSCAYCTAHDVHYANTSKIHFAHCKSLYLRRVTSTDHLDNTTFYVKLTFRSSVATVLT